MHAASRANGPAGSRAESAIGSCGVPRSISRCVIGAGPRSVRKYPRSVLCALAYARGKCRRTAPNGLFCLGRERGASRRDTRRYSRSRACPPTGGWRSCAALPAWRTPMLSATWLFRDMDDILSRHVRARLRGRDAIAQRRDPNRKSCSPWTGPPAAMPTAAHRRSPAVTAMPDTLSRGSRSQLLAESWRPSWVSPRGLARRVCRWRLFRVLRW